MIYRETRAQELVDLLWATPISPWHHRINMLGDPGHRELQVTQAAWIRALLASFVKKWVGQRISIGGLYGTKYPDRQVLPWDLYTQAAFLIVIGLELQDAIEGFRGTWAAALRNASSVQDGGDPAFFGRHNLLNQDQGVRTVLQVANDIFFVRRPDFTLAWLNEADESPAELVTPSEADRVQKIVAGLRTTHLGRLARDLGQALCTYDWRASSAPGVRDREELRNLKQSFRGSSGYRRMREDVLLHLSRGDGWVATAAKTVCSGLGYDLS